LLGVVAEYRKRKILLDNTCSTGFTGKRIRGLYEFDAARFPTPRA
jgi:hypothetical protein